MSVTEWLLHATSRLAEAGIGTARLDALIMLEDATDKNRAQLLINDQHELSAEQISLLNGWLDRRATHEPLAYIRQTAAFYGRDFFIDHRVLQPRPESETMIDLLKTLSVDTVLDVGTGSGALGITAALETKAHVSLLELDDGARAVARHNLELFNLDLPLIKSDLLNNASGHYGALLCNLPYVPLTHTINQAALHEPAMAIFGGDDGLDLYRRLFAQADADYILTESLPPQHEALAALAADHGFRLQRTEDFIQLFSAAAP